MEMIGETFFELPEPWQVYVFSRLCEDLFIDYNFGQYVSDSKVIVARVEGNSERIEELNLQWAEIQKDSKIKGILNEMTRLLLKKIIGRENDEE